MATRITKRKNKGYVLYFLNPLNRENKQIASIIEEKEAIEFARETDANFYSKHPYLLPSGISLSKKNKTFRVYTRYGFFESQKTLMQAVEQKQNIINDLIKMKYIDRNKSRLITNKDQQP